MESAHLLRSPENARRLLPALKRTGQGKGKAATAAELRREILVSSDKPERLQLHRRGNRGSARRGFASRPCGRTSPSVLFPFAQIDELRK